MRLIKAPNSARAHELAVAMVMKYGYPITTEDGEETIECEEICVEISEPFSEPRISPKNPMRARAITEYAKQLVEGGKNEFDYDYHERLFCYETDEHFSGLNQIEYVVDKLKDYKTSRRAIAITWRPGKDWISKNVPCLQIVLCTIRNGKLDMKVVFRSNDMLLAFGANVYGLTELQKCIADRLGVQVGKYTHISLMPHVYNKRDAPYLDVFVS